MKNRINNLARTNWLLDHDREESDVMTDADGLEYIMSDKGEGEMEDGVMTEFSGKKIYLPEDDELINETNHLTQQDE